jgi:hypothetical protein
MARKMMSREITTTTVKLAKMEVIDGQPQAVSLEDEILVGNITLEKAQKEMKKKHGEGVTVFTLIPNTQSYEMAVEDFLKFASVKPEESVQA